MTSTGRSSNPLTNPINVALGAIIAGAMAFFGFSAGQAATVTNPSVASSSVAGTTGSTSSGTTAGTTAPSVSAGSTTLPATGGTHGS